MCKRVYYLRSNQRVVFNSNTGEYSFARGNPLICLVSERDRESGTVKYGYSVIHSDDMKAFSKSNGRIEAEDKLEKNPLVVKTDATTGHDINRSIVQHFASTVGKRNGKVRKLTREWLKVSMAKLAKYKASET